MSKFSLPKVVLALLALASPAAAVQVLDQSHTPPALNLTSNVVASNMQAQVFQVGITGTLTQLDVIGSVQNVGNNLTVDIRKVSLLSTSVGHPPSSNPADILQSQIVTNLPPTPMGPMPPIGPNDFTSIPFNIPVVAGDMLAFVFHLDGNPGTATLRGGGTLVDGYVPGNLWTFGNISINGGNWYPNANSDFLLDLVFRTWVTEIPEPSALGLMGVLALGALRRGRARR